VTGAPHILIVEDQPSTAEMLTSYFETQGYKVTLAAWGKDALASAEKNPPDLIVLDIRLPDIDGYEVCRSLRAQRHTANIPIVFLTDKRSQGDKLNGLKLGAVDYITKPFDIQELRLRVRNILRRSSVDRMSHPITDLPGPAVSDEHLGELLTGSDWVVLSVGLHGLDEFADVYGFVARDDVMRAVALMLNHVVSESHDPNAFVGHLNDINFFVVIAPDEVEQVHQALSVRLKEAMAFFYPRIDLETGQKDAGTELPHLGITIGVLKSSAGPFSELEKLKHAIIEAQQTE